MEWLDKSIITINDLDNKSGYLNPSGGSSNIKSILHETTENNRIYVVGQNCFIQITLFKSLSAGFGAIIELDDTYEFSTNGDINVPLLFPARKGQVITWNEYCYGYLWEIPIF